jgi:hypothetical protein
LIIRSGLVQDKYIRGDDVLDIDIIPFLKSVFKKDRTLVFEDFLRKDATNAGIGVVKRVAGAMSYRVSEAYGGDAVSFPQVKKSQFRGVF